MVQAISIKVLLGPGQIDETRPIDLLEYAMPTAYTSKPKTVRPVPVNPAHFTAKIGGTTFEVSTHFSDDSRQSVLQQFKDLLLSGTHTK